LKNPNGFFAGVYGAGPIKFFRMLDKWRTEGDMNGVQLV